MAPLPPNSTPRFRFHYVCVGKEHTLQVRSSNSPAFVGTFVDNFLTALGSAQFIKTVTTVDWAPSGSDIFNPVTTGIEGSTYGSGAGASEQAAWAYTFLGRTSGGRRVRFQVYGATTLGADYQIGPGENVWIDAAITALVSAGGLVLGIDGLTPVWKSYADVQVNDHWVKNIRP